MLAKKLVGKSNSLVLLLKIFTWIAIISLIIRVIVQRTLLSIIYMRIILGIIHASSCSTLLVVSIFQKHWILIRVDSWRSGRNIILVQVILSLNIIQVIRWGHIIWLRCRVLWIIRLPKHTKNLVLTWIRILVILR